jgi:hypothetical protein
MRETLYYSTQRKSPEHLKFRPVGCLTLHKIDIFIYKCDVRGSNSSSAEVKNGWRCTSAPSKYLRGVERNDFIFFFFAIWL